MAIPIYLEQDRTYKADTCRPVTNAVEAGQMRQEALARGHYPGKRLPHGALQGVKVVGFWDSTHQQDWGLDWHRNEGIELTLLERGTLGFAVDEEQVMLKPGDLTFTRPWQQHRVGNPHVGAVRLHFLILDVGVRRPHQTWRWPSWIVLTPNDLRQLTDILRHNERPVWHSTPQLVECFTRIGAAIESDDEGSGISSLAVLINQLLLSLLEMLRQRNVRLDESLSSSRRTVELFWEDLSRDAEHLAVEWTVRKMAKQCGLGATSFIQYSRQLFNRTPMQHLSHCRLSLAAELLKRDKARSVTDIALSCGFASSQYFATLFRHRFNQTPREYRQETK